MSQATLAAGRELNPNLTLNFSIGQADGDAVMQDLTPTPISARRVTRAERKLYEEN